MDHVLDLIRSRRTRKRFGGAALPRSTLEHLLDALRWAPNHRLTQPWRCYVLDQPACHGLARWMQAHIDDLAAESDHPDKDRAKLAKLSQGYLPSLGAVMQITQVMAEDDLQDHEDHAAVAAGVQNLLLAAEALGLAAFWSSSGLMRNPLLLRHLGCDPTRERFVASIWLGERVDDPPAPKRQPIDTFTTWVAH